MPLFYDYRTNVESYTQWHRYFRDHKPPLLAVCGRNDALFLPAGAEAFRRDIAGSTIEFVVAGHFALETHAAEIGASFKPIAANRPSS